MTGPAVLPRRAAVIVFLAPVAMLIVKISIGIFIISRRLICTSRPSA